eukprot:g1540.t1
METSLTAMDTPLTAMEMSLDGSENSDNGYRKASKRPPKKSSKHKETGEEEQHPPRRNLDESENSNNRGDKKASTRSPKKSSKHESDGSDTEEEEPQTSSRKSPKKSNSPKKSSKHESDGSDTEEEEPQTSSRKSPKKSNSRRASRSSSRRSYSSEESDGDARDDGRKSRKKKDDKFDSKRLTSKKVMMGGASSGAQGSFSMGGNGAGANANVSVSVSIGCPREVQSDLKVGKLPKQGEDYDKKVLVPMPLKERVGQGSALEGGVLKLDALNAAATKNKESGHVPKVFQEKMRNRRIASLDADCTLQHGSRNPDAFRDVTVEELLLPGEMILADLPCLGFSNFPNAATSEAVGDCHLVLTSRTSGGRRLFMTQNHRERSIQVEETYENDTESRGCLCCFERGQEVKEQQLLEASIGGYQALYIISVEDQLLSMMSEVSLNTTGSGKSRFRAAAEDAAMSLDELVHKAVRVDADDADDVATHLDCAQFYGVTFRFANPETSKMHEVIALVHPKKGQAECSRFVSLAVHDLHLTKIQKTARHEQHYTSGCDAEDDHVDAARKPAKDQKASTNRKHVFWQPHPALYEDGKDPFEGSRDGWHQKNFNRRGTGHSNLRSKSQIVAQQRSKSKKIVAQQRSKSKSKIVVHQPTPVAIA